MTASGCSIYPVVQEATGKDTYGIVKNIRCEARAAIIDKFEGLLLESAYSDMPIYKGIKGRDWLYDLREGKPRYSDIKWDFVNPEFRANWFYYLRATISYDFTFDIEESNNQDLTFNIAATKFLQPSKLPFSLNNDRTRAVTRNFRVYDKWAELFTLSKWDNFCQSLQTASNILYPIAGYLNLKDMITQFVDLNQSNNLAGGKNGNAVFGDKISDVSPTLADTVEFTTKIQANFDPAAIIGPTVGRYTFTDLAFKFDNFRRDHHKVIVVVSLPPDQGGFTAARARLLAKGGSTNDPRTLAAEELARQRENSAVDSINRLVGQ